MAGIGDVFKTLKFHGDWLKRLQGRLDSISSGSTLIINGGPPVSGVLLSDSDPTPNNPGQPSAPGAGMEASRFDHQHETFEEQGAGKYLQFVYTGDDPFQFVTDEDGQPIFAELDVIPSP